MVTTLIIYESKISEHTFFGFGDEKMATRLARTLVSGEKVATGLAGTLAPGEKVAARLARTLAPGENLRGCGIHGKAFLRGIPKSTRKNVDFVRVLADFKN